VPATRPWVFCPAQNRSVDCAECRNCPRLVSFPESVSEPGAYVECNAVEPTPLGAPQDRGQTAPIGALATPRVVCVDAELSVERLSAAFREWSGVELPVIDKGGRLVGTILRSDFVRARRPGDARPSFEQTHRVAERVSRATALHESASVQHAVRVLASQRARTLILVQDEYVVVGVLTDLELLLGMSRLRRQPPEGSTP